MREPTHNFGVRLPVSCLGKLRYIAARDRRSTGGLLRLLAEEHVERFERENGEILLPGPVDIEKTGE